MRSIVPSFLLGMLAAAPVLAAGSGATTQAEADRSEGSTQPPAELSERHVVLMPTVGVWNHPFEQSGWTAKPGPIGGLDVKIEPYRWLAVRASMLRGAQPVEISAGQMSSDAAVYQPTLKITQLQLRVEPTLRLLTNLQGYVGLGIGWGRMIVPEAVATPHRHNYERSAVHLGYEGAIGIAYEPRADRIVLDISIAGSLLSSQTGTAYDSAQAFTDAGHRTTIGGLSYFSGAYRAMFGIGFVL